MIFPIPDNRFIQEVYVDQEYKFLWPHYPVVIDIGANIGAFSCWIYDHADVIYAVEPLTENVEIIEKTIDLNRLSKIIVKEMAISDQSIPKVMLRNGDPKGGGWRLDEAGGYPVSCRTLEDFMNSCEIEYADLVKMDVEGEELKILKTEYFPKDRIGTIIGEYHQEPSHLKKTLEWLGFTFIDFKNSHFMAKRIIR